MEIRVIRNIDQKTANKMGLEIYFIALKAYSENIQSLYDVDYFVSQLLNQKTINVVAIDQGKISAHALAVPHHDAFVELQLYDPYMKDAGDEKMYLESLISINKRTSRVSFLLLNEIARQAWNRGCKRVSMHVRKSTGLSERICANYPVEVFWTVDDWYWYHEPFDYAEADLARIPWIKS